MPVVLHTLFFALMTPQPTILSRRPALEVSEIVPCSVTPRLDALVLHGTALFVRSSRLLANTFLVLSELEKQPSQDS